MLIKRVSGWNSPRLPGRFFANYGHALVILASGTESIMEEHSVAPDQINRALLDPDKIKKDLQEMSENEAFSPLQIWEFLIVATEGLRKKIREREKYFDALSLPERNALMNFVNEGKIARATSVFRDVEKSLEDLPPEYYTNKMNSIKEQLQRQISLLLEAAKKVLNNSSNEDTTLAPDLAENPSLTPELAV